MDDKKRVSLTKIIEELADDKALSKIDSKKFYYNRLNSIYYDKSGNLLRHYYSDIFPVLTKIKKDNKNVVSVGSNLEIIYKYSLTKQDHDFSMALRKLWDHTNLEIARIEYVTSIDARMNMTGESLKKEYDKIKQQADDISKKQNKINESINSMTATVKRVKDIYSEFVSILGIFSAIVLVYFGGTSILGKSISSINNTFVLKSILICLITGLIVFNIIFMFLYFLSKLLDRSISATNDYVAYYDIFDRFKLRYPIIYYTNVLCLIAIVVDIICWIGYVIYNNPKICNDIYLYIVNLSQNIKVYLTLIFIIFNLFYFLYYLFCKITNKLIGNYITLRYRRKYDIIEVDNEYQLINEYGYSYKSYSNRCYAELAKFFKNNILILFNPFINLFLRLFRRHKVFGFMNLLFLIIYIFLYKIA